MAGVADDGVLEVAGNVGDGAQPVQRGRSPCWNWLNLCLSTHAAELW